MSIKSAGVASICIFFLSMTALAQGAALLAELRSLPVDMPSRQADVPLGVHVYLDRVVYTDRDRDGQGLVVINPPALLYAGKLKGHRVRVAIEGPQGNQVGEARELIVTDSDHFAIDLDMPAAAMGIHKIFAQLVGPDGRTLVTGQAEFTKRQDTSPLPASLPVDVPLVLTVHPPLAQTCNVPISTGIPLPDGLLHDASQVMVIEDGVREVPSQAVVRARWTRRGSIKWLGLDFQAKYDNGEPHAYSVRLGRKGEAKHPRPVVLEETPETFILSNGVVSVTLGRQSFRMFEKVMFDRNGDGQFSDREMVIQAKPLDGAYWENAQGKVFHAALDAQPQLTVEEAGPMRTTIRADGWLTASDGERAGKFITRMTLQAGSPQVAVNHTLVITWDTNFAQRRIRDMGVSVSPIDLRKTYQMSDTQHELPEKGSMYMLLDRWDRFMVAESESGKVLQSGNTESLRYNVTNWLNSRTPVAFGGWGPRGTVMLAQRYMAEKFPKEISVGRNSLTWHAWPRHGTSNLGDGMAEENLGNLFWLHQGELLDFRIPDETFTAVDQLRQRYPGVKVTLLMYKDHDNYAMGTAITGELLYSFAPENTGNPNLLWRQLAPRIRVFEGHPQACADPKWAAGTDLLEFAPPKDPGYGEIERGISTLFDRMYACIEKDQTYGQFLWPNGTTYTGRRFGALHRNRVNAHHGTELAGWGLYLRSGEAKYWHYTSAFSRYLLDHASVNYDPYDPKTDPTPKATWPGSVYHCQGLVPWSVREPELLGHMSPQWHACLLYYMTGDTQALDFAKSAATSVLKSVRTEKDYRVREPYGGKLNRNPACGWAMIANLYVELLDPRLLRPIADIGKQIFDGPDLRLDTMAPPEGQSGRWWFHTYNQHWRDPKTIDAINNISPLGQSSFAGYNIHRLRTLGDPTGVYALWLETQGLAPLRQWGMGHPSMENAASPVADNFNFLMPMVGAMRALQLPEAPPLVPTGLAPGESKVVFRKDTDGPFNIRFWGPVYEGPEDLVKYKPLPYVIENPRGEVIVKGEINRKALGITPDKGIHLTIAADGMTGDYTLRLTGPNWVSLVAPLSDLAHEVYVVPAKGNLTAPHLFWRTGPEEHQRTLSPHAMGLGDNYSTMIRLERTDGSVTAEASSPIPIRLQVQPDTMYHLSMCVAGQTGYAWRWRGILVPMLLVSPGPDMVLSVDESRWFMPRKRP